LRPFLATLIDTVLAALAVGTVLAILQVLPEVVANRHLQHGAYRLVLLLLEERIALSTSVLGAAAVVSVILGRLLIRGDGGRAALAAVGLALAVVGLAVHANLGDVEVRLQNSALA